MNHEPQPEITESLSQSLESLLRDRLWESWKEYISWRRRFLAEGSPASVHGLRTSTRRLSSRAELVEAVHANKKPAKHLKDLLSRERKCLDTARDSYVQRNSLKKSPPAYLKIGKYRDHLKQTTKKGTKKAFRKIEHWSAKKRQKALDKVEALLKEIIRANGEEKATREVKKLYRKDLTALKKLSAKLRAGDHKLFHSLRIQVKDFAYKTETLHSFLDIPSSSYKELMKLRQKLGELQDLVIFKKSAKGYLRKVSHHPHPRKEIERDIEKRERAIAVSASRLKIFRADLKMLRSDSNDTRHTYS
jgi:CHAD domain-containing protein